MGSARGSTEEPVLSAYHEGTDRILNHVRVGSQIGAVQVVLQLLPFLEGIIHRLAQESRGRNLESFRFKPLLEVLQNRQDLLLSTPVKRFGG